MAIQAGKAMVKIFADNSMLVRGLNQARAKLAGFAAGVQRISAGVTAAGAAMFGVGAVVAAGLGYAAFSFAKTGDALDKMSKRTGLAVEFLSELKFAAEQSGTSMEDMEKVSRTLSRSLLDASFGLKTSIDLFSALGLAWRDISRMSPADQMEQVFNALARIEDPARRAGIAMKLLGRSGTAVLPMIANFAALRKEAKALGLVWSGEDARGAAELTDAMNRLKRTSAALRDAIGSGLAPVLTELMTGIARRLAPIIRWVQVNRQLAVSVAKLALAAVAAGAGLLLIGKALAIAGMILSGIGIALGVIGSVIGALLSPFGLLLAGIAAVAYAFYRFTSEGRKSSEDLRAGLTTLQGTATAVFGAIKNAMSKGDLAAAARVLWLGIKVEWLAGTLWLRATWAGVKNFFLDTVGFMVAGAVARLASMWASIRAVWEVGAYALGEIWRTVSTTAQLVWNDLSTALKIGWSNTAEAFTGAWMIAVNNFKSMWADAYMFVAGILVKLIRSFRQFTAIQALVSPGAAILAAVASSDKLRAIEEDLISGSIAKIEQGGERSKAYVAMKAEAEMDRSGIRAAGRAGAEQISATDQATADANLARLKERVLLLDMQAKATAEAADAQAKYDSAGRRSKDADRLLQLQERLKQARAELAAAIAEANATSKVAEEKAASVKGGVPAGMAGLTKKFDVSGTFSAVAALGLGLGSSAVDRIADASQKTADNTKTLVDRSTDGLVFG